MIHEPDIGKLRRFSLAIALVILTYSIAGISLEPNSPISLIGLTFRVSRPDLLPIGLIIASVYSTISFYYYGFMLKKSPFRIRRDIIDGLNSWEPNFTPGKNVPVYFGPREFETSPWQGHKEVESYVANFPEAFPKFARARASAQVISEQFCEEDGKISTAYAAKVVIPIRCRIAAIFQDIDFSSPIWLNIIALAIFFMRMG
jgi:hypothetical protein